jgi:hypothetical protein
LVTGDFECTIDGIFLRAFSGRGSPELRKLVIVGASLLSICWVETLFVSVLRHGWEMNDHFCFLHLLLEIVILGI